MLANGNFSGQLSVQSTTLRKATARSATSRSKTTQTSAVDPDLSARPVSEGPHSTRKVTAITAVMSLSMVRVS